MAIHRILPRSHQKNKHFGSGKRDGHSLARKKNDLFARSNSWLFGEPGSKDPGRKSRRAEIKGVNVMHSALRRAILMKFRGPQNLSDNQAVK